MSWFPPLFSIYFVPNIIESTMMSATIPITAVEQPTPPTCPFGTCHLQSEREEAGLMLPPGIALYREGEWNDNIYCLRAGRIAISRRDSSGTLRIAAIAEPGDLLGIDSLPLRTQHQATALALQASHLCVIPRLALVESVSTSWECACRLLQQMSNRLERIESFLECPE